MCIRDRSTSVNISLPFTVTGIIFRIDENHETMTGGSCRSCGWQQKYVIVCGADMRVANFKVLSLSFLPVVFFSYKYDVFVIFAGMYKIDFLESRAGIKITYWIRTGCGVAKVTKFVKEWPVRDEMIKRLRIELTKFLLAFDDGTFWKTVSRFLVSFLIV